MGTMFLSKKEKKKPRASFKFKLKRMFKQSPGPDMNININAFFGEKVSRVSGREFGYTLGTLPDSNIGLINPESSFVGLYRALMFLRALKTHVQSKRYRFTNLYSTPIYNKPRNLNVVFLN